MEAQVCPNCGEENPPKFRLCGYCGTPLAQALPPQELRKTVTIIFSDLQGSTALGEMVDPEALHEIKNRYFEAMAAVLAQHGGKIEKYIGDAIMAVFGLPRVREDDALRAVRAAAGMQAALAEINVELERAYGIRLAARMGVNTGEVVATADPNADQRLADGDAVNVAARLEQAAPAMEVLIGDITYQLVRDSVEVEPVEPLTLKGKSEPVPAYRLVTVRSDADRRPATRAPLVGRDDELAVLRESFGESRGAGAARLVTVIGDAGVGKSRLLAEFVAAVADEARVVRGRCLPYGDGITFWPLVEVTREAAGIEEDDGPDTARAKIAALLPAEAPGVADVVDRVASAIGLSMATYPVSEVFWGVRRLLEALASERPLVVIVDDLQSAEKTFLELVDHLIESAERPILLLGSARHELLEEFAEWGDGERTRRIILHPLSVADSERMVEQLLGTSGLDAGVRRRVAEAAEGNPLFVEQLVSMLVDRGALQRVGETWVAEGDLSELAIPPTIQALLAARLDHLSREERAVIEPASVIGFLFPQPAVAELVPDPLRAGVPAQLAVLDRKQFVHPAAGEDEAYRFHHLLIRDAAYGSLLKRSRAQLHEKFAAWAERVNREHDREMEFEEILGYHLEQAYRYRQDLGPIDDEGREVGRRAANKLASAGRRAAARGDMPAAATLLGRAVALLPPDGVLRRELLPELAEALIEEGEFDTATATLDESAAIARETGDERLACRAELERFAVELYQSETTDSAAVDEATERAIAVFDRAGDEDGLARAWRLRMLTYGTAGRLGAAGEAAERYVRHATRAGDPRLAARGAAGYATVALHGPAPAPEVIARCEELLVEVRGDRKAEAVIVGVLGVLHAMQGSFDEARTLYRQGRRSLEELGRSVTAASTSTESARVELLADDPAAAERELRRDHDALEAMGERYFRSTVAALLAEALYLQGRFDEADERARLAEELAADDDVLSHVIARGVRARLLCRDGQPAEAIALAHSAVEMAASSEDVDMLADVHRALADVLATIGDGAAADASLRAALELYERKGNQVAAGRIRDRLAERQPV